MNYNQFKSHSELLKAYDEVRLISKGKRGAHPRLTYYVRQTAMKIAAFVEVTSDGKATETPLR